MCIFITHTHTQLSYTSLLCIFYTHYTYTYTYYLCMCIFYTQLAEKILNTPPKRVGGVFALVQVLICSDNANYTRRRKYARVRKNFLKVLKSLTFKNSRASRFAFHP